MIYFDNSSTTSVRAEVSRIYAQLIQEAYANPDAMHTPGREVSKMMETSRKKIAEMLKVAYEEVLFTSSASESNSLAIIGYCLANSHRGKHILLSNAEHASVSHSFEWLQSMGFEVEYLSIDANGKVTPQELKNKIRKDTILVSCMHVNNEMGAINPIDELADVVHTHPTCVFHCDCVQSFSKIDIPFEKLDLATLSMHKIHGLKGSGILIKKKKVQLMPLIQGGQQEFGLRGGTSNAPVNICAAKTIRLALQEQKALPQTGADKCPPYRADICPPEIEIEKEIDIEIEKERELETGHPAPAAYGRYHNVILSDTELDGLKTELPGKWEYYIDRLSCHIASSGRKYKSHAATIFKWAQEDAAKKAPKKGIPDYTCKEGESL